MDGVPILAPRRYILEHDLAKDYDLKSQLSVAKIIFLRLAAQVSSTSVTDQIWSEGVEGFRRQPELFPLIEACVDAAGEILDHLRAEKARDQVGSPRLMR